MNQGSVRQLAAYRQKQGAEVLQDATAGQLHPEQRQEAATLSLVALDFVPKSNSIFHGENYEAIRSTQLIHAQMTLDYVHISRLLDAYKH